MLFNKRNQREKKPISRGRMNFQLFMQDVHYNLKNSSHQKKLVAFGKLLILLFIMVGVPIIMFITMKDSLLSTDYWAGLPDKLGNNKILSFIILMLLQMSQIVVCVLPGQPIQMASSYQFGIGGGYIICILGSLLGCIVTYYLGSFFGSDALRVVFGEAKVKDYIRKLNSSKAYFIIFLIYLIPLIPKDLASYVAGVSSVRLKPFLLAATIGRTPTLLASLLIGTYIKQKNYLGIAIAVTIVLIILFICWKKRDALTAKLASYEDHDDEETSDK